MKPITGSHWTVDWHGQGEPLPGQVVRRVSPTGRVSYYRTEDCHLVRHRVALPVGSVARYRIRASYVGDLYAGAIAWTMNCYGRRRTESARYSPLL